MKLKKLYIKKYKNLKNIDIKFEENNGLNIIVGSNGSGKSNILEVISAIFFDVYKDKNFFFKINDEYILEYVINGINITIEKKDGKRKFKNEGSLCTRKSIIDNALVPSNVIAVYSGEELRLWEDFYEEYYKKYIKNLDSSYIKKMKLMFINKNYWNIALLLLLITQNRTLEGFLKFEIGDLKNVKITFKFGNLSKLKNELLKTFIKKINPNNYEEITLNKEELSTIIYEQNDPDSLIFQYFSQATILNIIKNIEIKFNGNLTLKSLSEGEKKLTLIKAVLEFLSDERTLILFDEPDAFIHESKKIELYDLLKLYAKDYERNIVFTTHSPTIVNSANSDELIILKTIDNKCSIVQSDKIEIVKELTGSRMNVFFEIPILLVEGKSDIILIEKACNYFKKNETGYEDLPTFRTYSLGGTGNTKYIYESFKKIFKGRKIIICLDRDDSGKKELKKFFPNNDLEENEYFNIEEENYIFLLPCIEEKKEFMIEEYFSKEYIKKLALEMLNKTNFTGFKDIPNIKDRIKNKLGEEGESIPNNELKRFQPLVDLIRRIILI